VSLYLYIPDISTFTWYRNQCHVGGWGKEIKMKVLI